jgi:pimeloyl-ACP methyl ester carboxylesterase
LNSGGKNVITKEHCFHSSGYKLKAVLYLPDDYKEGEKRPCVIPNSGYMGLNRIYPALFARALTARGYVAFGFDYRGFLDNDGPAGVCKLEEQAEDIRNASVYARTLPEVDAGRVGLLGWGMGAALVTAAAAREPDIRAVAGVNGFYNGERWLKTVYSYVEFQKLRREVQEERIRLVREGVRRFDNPFRFYPLDPDTDDVVKDNLYTVKGYGQEISLELGQSLLEFDAEKYAGAIRVPVMVCHGRDNLLHPLEESLLFYDRLSDPKELLILNGKHNDFMFDGHPVFESLSEALGSFFSKTL